MKCADCGRQLLKAALQIDSQHGPIAFGPKCAKRYIVRPTRTAYKVLDRAPAKAQPRDPRQVDWVEALAC